VRPLGSDPNQLAEAAVALRRTIHANPETAFEEISTARLVAERMRTRGLDVRTEVGTTGVVALLDSGRPGKTVLLRADLDALPVEERTGLPFAATNGKMHACGHDGHVAALDMAADLLILEPPASGRVLFAFQPAEEGTGGATAMIAGGVLDDPRPDAVFALHLWTPLPLGTVGVAAGPVMAAVDEFRISITGPGGHAASPHETRDTVLAAAHVVGGLPSVVSRRLPPLQPALVSVTSIHGGTAFNVVPEEVVLTGTCRAFDAESIARLPGLVADVAAAAATVTGCRAETTYLQKSRAVVNDPAEAARAARVAALLVGEMNVTADCRTMGGEDFSEFLARVPGAFVFVGAARADEPDGRLRPHHAPVFDFDERALPLAARLHAAWARSALAGA